MSFSTHQYATSTICFLYTILFYCKVLGKEEGEALTGDTWSLVLFLASCGHFYKVWMAFMTSTLCDSFPFTWFAWGKALFDEFKGCTI